MNDTIPSTPYNQIRPEINGSRRMKGPEQVVTLPLNLIVVIFGYLDDPADLARCCRTSRVLRYITIPQLYHTVSLRSYAEIRYIDGFPEALGGASPFVMGLNGLVTSNVASLVRCLSLEGEMKENDVQEHIRAGRIPDKVMLLNMAIRSAIDKTVKLQSFCWKLDNKPLQTVYQGLSNLQGLTSLSLAFPSSRTPRSPTLIPPIVTLRKLKVTNIDPLCYPDDISLLLVKATKLEKLIMHWSPRIRESLEPSIHLQTYFGRCATANHVLPIKHLGLFNLYCAQDINFVRMLDLTQIESVELVKSIGSSETVFLDKTWDVDDYEAGEINTTLRFMRTDNMSKKNCHLFGRNTGLQRVYLLNSQGRAFFGPASPGGLPLPSAASSETGTPIDGPTPENLLRTSVGKEYLRLITRNHGSTLRHLLLSDRWSLSQEDLALLVRSCPNLTQLGMALEVEVMEVMKMLLPFLPELRVVRILENPHDESARAFIHENSPEAHMQVMSHELAKPETQKIRYIGAGPYIFEAGAIVRTGHFDEYGEPVCRRAIRQVAPEQVKHIAIWAMDTPEVLED
ncbi:MAG: hypothetical protein M1814_003099 [Vezdaea aestivalis]|nr:MAG: hypothetical protein M1814_003099 [Vezdaea aestivalis]